MVTNNFSSHSNGNTPQQIGEFWDDHDFTDFDTDIPDVPFQVTCIVPIDVEIYAKIEQQAQKRGISVETIVNLWLQQKLSELQIA